MLRLSGISKTYGAAVALGPLDLSFAQGKTTALLGPSGCGKSTLLRIVVGVVQPDQGQVLLDGKPITRSNLLRARHHMGYVIQDGGLFPHLTAEENVALLARHLHWSAERVQERIGELRTLTRLPQSLLKRYPAELSGGQQQRVALMRALMIDPAVLLLDEPLGALDPMIRAELQNELREIFQSLAKTVVLVTHDIAEAGFLADTVVLMRSGQIVQRGRLEEMLRQPADPFVVDFFNAQRRVLGVLDQGMMP